MSEPAAEGWLTWARRVPSPNCDCRPAGVEASLVVIHSISLPPGVYGTGDIERLFTNALAGHAHPFVAGLAPARVSAHFLVSRDGSVTQFVPLQLRAWHAGVSSFRGRAHCNDWSVGIELEGSEFERFDAYQYAALSRLIGDVRASCPLQAIVGHSDIAPGRKSDPGPFFDWAALAADPALASLLTPHPRISVAAAEDFS